MLAKDAVGARLDSEEGISYTEFSYQILQGMDYLELFRGYGCTLQTGGSRPVGQPHQRRRADPQGRGRRVHAIGTPLITNGRRHQVRQERGQRDLARPRA